MFNRVVRFALCLALLSLSACAGASRQTHGTAQRQDPLLRELIIIGTIADAAGNGSRDNGNSGGGGGGSGGGGSRGGTLVAVGAVAIVAGIAYLVLSDSGDVDAPKAAPQPFKSGNNVGLAPNFIQAAQRSAL